MGKVNWIAILVIAVIQMVISAFWYGLFADPWMAGTGVTEEMATANADYSMYIVAFIGYIALNYIMAIVLPKMGITSIGQALMYGFLFWLAFFFFQEGTHYLFAFKSWSLIMIDTANTLICYLLAATVLTLWKA